MKIFELPANYGEFRRIDLQNNIKLAVFVNVLSFLIAAVMAVVGCFIDPINIPALINLGIYKLIISMLVLITLMIVYIVLHELVHGIFFRVYSGEKASYGFTGLYAFAKSRAYFNKKEYLIIGLSPIVILGAVCLVLNIVFGHMFFWYIYMVQIINISGAAGDLYVTYVMSKMPSDILVKDDGTAMTVYAHTDKEKTE